MDTRLRFRASKRLKTVRARSVMSCTRSDLRTFNLLARESNMKRSTLLFAVIAMLARSTFEFGASTNGKLDEVLANMERAARSIKTIEADMNQEKRNMQIGGKEFYKGRIYFEHGK